VQVGEVLVSEENITLHNDGTSNRGHHFDGVQLTAHSASYSLGMDGIVSGTSQKYFDNIMKLLNECDRLLSKRDNADSKMNSMLLNIKNRMSDKHVVE
jgi:hypothetical protein